VAQTRNIVETTVSREFSSPNARYDGISKFSLSRTHFNTNEFGRPADEDFQTVGDVIKKIIRAVMRRNLAQENTVNCKDPISRSRPARSDKGTHRNKYFACGELGHWASDCPGNCYALENRGTGKIIVPISAAIVRELC
jgi:Zinc knuckle